jgi:hypothetical protein
MVYGAASRPDSRAARYLIAAVIAVALVRVVAARPGPALAFMIVYLPLQQALLAYAYARGMPVGLVRQLGFVKELGAGAVLAALLEAKRRPRPLHRVDVLALAFLGVAILYLVAPAVIPGPFGSQKTSVRLAAFQLNVGFLVLFLACRRLNWTRRDLQLLALAAVVPAVVLAGTALWEQYGNESFVRFINSTLQFPSYRYFVLHQLDAQRFESVRSPLGSGHTLRVGGWLGPLQVGFLLVLPLALCLRRQLRQRNNAVSWVILGAIALTLVMTLTRSSLLGSLVASALILGSAAHYRLPGLSRLLLLGLAGVLVLAPVAGSTDVIARIGGAVNGTDTSTQIHSRSTSKAFDDLASAPIGLGLGYNPVSASLAGLQAGAPAENAYLQIGKELGVLAMGLFVALVFALQRDLRRGSRDDDESGVVTAIWAAGWGLAVNALFLHVWLSLSVSLTFWALAGIASSPSLRQVERDSEPVLALRA